MESLPRLECSYFAKWNPILFMGSGINQWQICNLKNYVQCCRVLRFFKALTWIHSLDQMLFPFQRASNSVDGKSERKRAKKSVAKLKIKELCSMLPLFEIFKNNTWSHIPNQNVVDMQNIINIGAVVWQLTQSASDPVRQ